MAPSNTQYPKTDAFKALNKMESELSFREVIQVSNKETVAKLMGIDLHPLGIYDRKIKALTSFEANPSKKFSSKEALEIQKEFLIFTLSHNQETYGIKNVETYIKNIDMLLSSLE